jgi:hypothetical protein
MRGTRAIALAVALGVALLAAAGLAADKKGKKLDLIWTHPDFTGASIQRIAMLPACSYTHDIKAEKLAEDAWGQSFRGAGYRWISSVTTRDLLRREPGGDSLLKVLNEGVLKSARVDSLSAPALCARLRVSALLSVRLDTWEQLEMEWNQAGKPSTTVQVKAALVDSTGRLLWSAAGSETGEGPYHEPSANVGVKPGGLGTQPLTAQSGAPSFAEVAGRLFARWATQFPSKTAPAGGQP